MNQGIVRMSPQFALLPRGLLGAPKPIPTPLGCWPFDSNNITGGLVGWWKFDEINGTVGVDSSGNGMHGTLTGGQRFSEVPGIIGNCGQNATLSVPSNALLNFTGDFTMCGWGKGSGTFWGMGKNNGSNGFGQYGFSMRNGGTYNGIYFRHGGVIDTSPTTDISASIQNNQWHHFCATRTGLVMAIYIDGAKIAVQNATITSAVQSFASNTTPLSLYGVGATGFVDDMRMYNRALSAAEVKALYEYRGRNVYESP